MHASASKGVLARFGPQILLVSDLSLEDLEMLFGILDDEQARQVNTNKFLGRFCSKPGGNDLRRCRQHPPTVGAIVFAADTWPQGLNTENKKSKHEKCKCST